ncbi:bifunctional riboflavin kinase/FAD synthetase [Halobacillus sp. BBL2006]|uniref:bifunctional riboflavin kinase/FAD synthetase n=1 Tax=Halobacillus sp. BBL2006 TaxID=1543706 RepID=UPI000543325F|nr:bifunctional riboflavin kinase/FAD synthetase [Halobacillus sp. BBL2006]KHE72963.1 riboflavin biosynthesis protein RibF [Halobacillus sp. BBL2006]
MEMVRLSHDSMTEDLALEPSVTAVGFFDGIHKGHQKVIGAAKEKARELGLKCAVMTFDPHPSVVLKKGKQQAHYITPLSEKEDILESLGVDYLFVITFNTSLATLSPQQFVDDFFVGLKIKHVVAGFDFSYGHKGKGSMEDLPKYARGRFSQTVIPKVEKNEEKVSSTRVRTLLDKGEVDKANDLLGRSYSVKGIVGKGDQRGRTIGYPTANVEIKENYYLPKVGVYAVQVQYDGEQYYGMANLGYKPTFVKEAEKPSLEVHLFDINKDLYNQSLTVFFLQLIRDEKKFEGVAQVKEQLEHDEAHIREFFRIG